MRASRYWGFRSRLIGRAIVLAAAMMTCCVSARAHGKGTDATPPVPAPSPPAASPSDSTAASATSTPSAGAPQGATPAPAAKSAPDSFAKASGTPPLPSPDPAPTYEAASPPSSDYTIEGDMPVLNIEYRTRPRIAGKFKIRDGTQKQDKLVIVSKTTSGSAPQEIMVEFQMNHGKAKGKFPLKEKLTKKSTIQGNNGKYEINRQMLDNFASEFIDAVNTIENGFDANTPVEQKDPVDVVIKPLPVAGVSDPLKDGVKTTNTLAITFQHVFP